MSDRDDFLEWVTSELYRAELALHNGDSGPRRELWSRNQPVSVLGAWRTYTLRATQVYRREDGKWKVSHRHADTVNEDR
jgi:ketosteroid isomerase-like protein